MAKKGSSTQTSTAKMSKGQRVIARGKGGHKKKGTMSEKKNEKQDRQHKMEVAFTGQMQKALQKHHAPSDDVFEIFSQPRLVPAAQNMELKAAWSLDLECGWNALNQRQADLAKKLQGHIRPRFMMASPPCTMYSPLMRLWNFRKMQPAVRKRRQGEADSMVDTAVDRCLEQHDRGDLFAFEHPANASSWRQHRKLAKARKTKNTYEVLFDQCAVGLRSPSGKPMKKRTRLWTNSLAMVRRFKVMQCKCQQPRKRICGSEMGYKLSKWAQCYPKKMVNTLLLGAKDDMSK